MKFLFDGLTFYEIMTHFHITVNNIQYLVELDIFPVNKLKSNSKTLSFPFCINIPCRSNEYFLFSNIKININYVLLHPPR